jgi:proteasome lid subunit RPN8/RPN11
MIRFTQDQMSFLVEETKEKYPLEACGLLFGDMGKGEAVARGVAAAYNTLESSSDFQIDPEEFLEALARAEEENMEHLGFFHSHPASPKPSASDIRYMNLWPESIWLIISSIDYEMVAYQILNGSCEGVNLKVIDRER